MCAHQASSFPQAVLEQARHRLLQIIAEHRLADEPVRVRIGTLSSQQSIGSPPRHQDFALLEGREVMIEAEFRDSAGQAFTDHPQARDALLKDIVAMDLGTSDRKAIFLATLNSVMADLRMITGVRHCRDEEPDRCGREMADYIVSRCGKVRVGLVGYQPAILENLVNALEPDRVKCTDLNPKNVGSCRYGIQIWDGRRQAMPMIEWCDLLLATSSTLGNGTFDALSRASESLGKRLVLYGVTGAGVAALFGLERACFMSH